MTSCPAVPAVTAYEHMSVFPRAGGHTAALPVRFEDALKILDLERTALKNLE